MMFAVLASVVVSYIHVFLSPPDAISFAQRWRPNVAAGNVVSISGINKYSRACIDLNSIRCTGAVVQLDDDGMSCMYILHRNTSSNPVYDDGDDVQVVSILWQHNRNMIVNMRALRMWFDERFVDGVYGDLLKDEVERDMWYISGMDA